MLGFSMQVVEIEFSSKWRLLRLCKMILCYALERSLMLGCSLQVVGTGGVFSLRAVQDAIL